MSAITNYDIVQNAISLIVQSAIKNGLRNVNQTIGRGAVLLIPQLIPVGVMLREVTQHYKVILR